MLNRSGDEAFVVIAYDAGLGEFGTNGGRQPALRHSRSWISLASAMWIHGHIEYCRRSTLIHACVQFGAYEITVGSANYLHLAVTLPSKITRTGVQWHEASPMDTMQAGAWRGLATQSLVLHTNWLLVSVGEELE